MSALTKFSKSTDEKHSEDSFVLPWSVSHNSKMITNGSKDSSSDMPILLQHLPVGVLVEYQKILENLFSIRIHPDNQIIGITSTHAHEGTSTIAAILSLLAGVQPCFYFKPAHIYDEKERQQPSRESGSSQNILLIDTQIKHPTQHQLFKVANQPGLIDYMERKEHISDSLRQIEHSRLKIIPAGVWTNESIHHIYSDIFITLLQQLRHYVYFIFLDIPALLDYAESITLCKLCDGVILNVKSASTRLETVQEATHMLQKAHVNILGTILNNRKSYIPNWIRKYL